MKTLKIAELDPASHGRVCVGERRLFPAFIAAAFPMLFFVFLLVGFIRTGFSITKFLEHTILVIALVPGLVAMVAWCWRYLVPALRAIGNPSPIHTETGSISVYGCRYAISDEASLSYSHSKILIIDKGKKIAEFPAFFIRIRSS